jgi:AcrR family transcriptional regulator
LAFRELGLNALHGILPGPKDLIAIQTSWVSVLLKYRSDPKILNIQFYRRDHREHFVSGFKPQIRPAIVMRHIQLHNFRTESMEGSRASRNKATRSTTRKLGKREANKLDKLERVKRAARQLFTTVGYDEATTRQIAKKAGVALGTVFTYASTKRDLLFLVSNDLLDEARHKAEASFQRNRTIQHNFVMFCAVFYRVLQAQPELSKLVFRELLFYDSGIHSMRALANRARTLKNIEALVVNAHERGEIRLPESPDFIAWVLFSIFQAENRRWLALARRDLEEGLSHLWRSVGLLLNGLSVRPSPQRPSRALLRRLSVKM